MDTEITIVPAEFISNLIIILFKAYKRACMYDDAKRAFGKRIIDISDRALFARTAGASLRLSEEEVQDILRAAGYIDGMIGSDLAFIAFLQKAAKPAVALTRYEAKIVAMALSNYTASEYQGGRLSALREKVNAVVE